MQIVAYLIGITSYFVAVFLFGNKALSMHFMPNSMMPSVMRGIQRFFQMTKTRTHPASNQPNVFGRRRELRIASHSSGPRKPITEAAKAMTIA